VTHFCFQINSYKWGVAAPAGKGMRINLPFSIWIDDDQICGLSNRYRPALAV